MRLDDERESSNVEDRRGSGGRVPIGGKSIGLGTIAIALLAMYFGIDPSVVLNIGQGLQQEAPVEAQVIPANDPMAKFVAKVLGSTEDTWGKVFEASGQQYPAPKLVLFRGQTPTACGSGRAAMGPFYCPGDQKVYIDLGFYHEMKTRFKAPGDFAQAYVIAHEVGHHIQNLMGTSDKVQQARQNARSEAQANQYSVRLELQADCYAGVWANHADGTNRILEAGDVEEAMTAAAAIGDDALQKQAQGYVVPDSFTHGTSQQRMRWFNQGLSTGDIRKCDTFSVASI
ncbi:MAG: neutral zinc metallopeptidase [Methylotenera sp.]|uniref:KPN_02809 family neutral zinc metallopeptidase n=1 Tax=Methylotenera sp. TaxID=2051956 RepID=UPI00272EF263|nr:neutral zinc metallopeptidase [Methylotenera sp.]MDP1523012.1 neutral zinc metallopeptidase [Methylotenera sp.]